MTQQKELILKINQMWSIYEKCMANVARAYDELPVEVYKDGVLSGKIKRLMALPGTLVHGCMACILYQTEKHWPWVPHWKRLWKPAPLRSPWATQWELERQQGSSSF